YGLLSVATALPWTFMWRHLIDRPDLLEPPLDAAYARAELRRGSIGPVIYALAIPIAILAPLVALLFYVGIAVLYAVTSQGTQPASMGSLREGPRRGACAAPYGWSTAYSCQASGTPLSSNVPRSAKDRPEPTTRSFTVLDTRTSPALASAPMRAPIWTARPRISLPSTSTSPVCRPARTSMPSGRTPSVIASAQRIPRAGPSNVARNPSPPVFTSRPV